MSFWAVGISSASSLGGSIYAADSAARSQRRTNAANLLQARETNDLNKLFFDQSRGSEGSAILPTYLSGYERALGMGAADLALLGIGDPAGKVAGFQSDVNALLPGTRGSTAAVNDLFTGGTLKTRLDALAPVAEARTTRARGRLAAIDQSLKETIGRLDAAMSRRGFSGGSSFDNRQLFGATLNARQAGADVLGEANIANAEDAASLRDADALMRIQLSQLPFEQARSLTALRSLPTNAAAAQAAGAMAPLGFFQLNPQAFQAAQLPQQQATMGTGGIIGAGVAAAGSTLGNFFANRNLAAQLGQRSQVPTPNYNWSLPAPATTPGSTIDFNLPQTVIP